MGDYDSLAGADSFDRPHDVVNTEVLNGRGNTDIVVLK
jgi:hypothetical protein